MSLPNPEDAGRAFAIMSSNDQALFFEAAVKEADTWPGAQAANSQWYWVGSLLRGEKHEGAREMIDMIHHAMNFKPTTPAGVGTSSSGSLPEETEAPEIDLAEPFLEIP